ncbi:MAG: hypothetical protein AB1831_10670 [Pseudomonadota bacterium]
MLTVQENFGQVAHTIHNHAPTQTILMSAQMPESRLQAQFAEDTGIHCNRPMREVLIRLMEHHGFTREELALAWKYDAIYWSIAEERVMVRTNFLLYAFGQGLFGLSLIMLLLATFGLSLGHPSSMEAVLYSLGGIPLFTFTLWFARRMFICPYHVAQRVRQVLATF